MLTADSETEKLRREIKEDVSSVLGTNVELGSFNGHGEVIEYSGSYGQKVPEGLFYTVDLTKSEESMINPLYKIKITTKTPAISVSPIAKVTTNINASKLYGRGVYGYADKIVEARQEMLEIKNLLKSGWNGDVQNSAKELELHPVDKNKFEMNRRTYEVMSTPPSTEIIGIIEGDSSVKAFVDDLNNKKSRKLLQDVLSAQAAKIERD